MIDPKQIPDEAVMAALDAYEDAVGGYTSRDWMRAAITAAINVWPEAGMRTIMDANGSYPTILLPLPAPEEKP